MKDFSKQQFFNVNSTLSLTEASNLAAELTDKLTHGKKLAADKASIQKIIAGLADQRGLLRRTFAESLGCIGTDALPELIQVLLESQSVIARRAAAKTIRLIGEASAIPHLIYSLLNDEDPVVQGSCVGALAIFGEEAVEALINVLENPTCTEMQFGLASWGISHIGANGEESIKKGAISKNEKVRASCIAALGETIQSLCDQSAKNILSDALSDTSNEVQLEAIKLIGLLEGQNWNLNLLASKLNDENPQIRKQSALSLMKLNAIEKRVDIEKCLGKEKNQDVIKVLKLCLKHIDN